MGAGAFGRVWEDTGSPGLYVHEFQMSPSAVTAEVWALGPTPNTHLCRPSTLHHVRETGKDHLKAGGGSWPGVGAKLAGKEVSEEGGIGIGGCPSSAGL